MTLKQAAGRIPVIGPLAKGFRDWVNDKSPLSGWIRRRRIVPRDKSHDYFRQAPPDGNDPENALGPDAMKRSAALLSLIDFLDGSSTILEVGCNVGRNLAYLYDAGFRNVEGIEISPHAVTMLRENYPQLASCQIYNDTAEAVLPALGAPYDLVFTMAVIQHIHTDSADLVFDNIARLGRSVLLIEPTRGFSSVRQYPHDVVQHITTRGFKLTKLVPLADMPETRGHGPRLKAYSAHLFMRR